MYTINGHGASLLSKKSYKSSFGRETLLMETALGPKQASFSGCEDGQGGCLRGAGSALAN